MGATLSIPRKAINDKLLYYLDTCARCGACSDACHFYAATGEPHHAPAYRMELLRRVYRRQRTWTGKMFAKLLKTGNVGSDEFLEEFRKAAFECTGLSQVHSFLPLRGRYGSICRLNEVHAL